tara:strand:+ start:1581 stop:1769 length:189 start_codon:yes stop_codon:yes gene_type:complete
VNKQSNISLKFNLDLLTEFLKFFYLSQDLVFVLKLFLCWADSLGDKAVDSDSKDQGFKSLSA